MAHCVLCVPGYLSEMHCTGTRENGTGARLEHLADIFSLWGKQGQCDWYGIVDGKPEANIVMLLIGQ